MEESIMKIEDARKIVIEIGKKIWNQDKIILPDQSEMRKDANDCFTGPYVNGRIQLNGLQRGLFELWTNNALYMVKIETLSYQE
jgi:hypothetical protein